MPFINQNLVNNLLPNMEEIRRYLRLANVQYGNSLQQRDARWLLSFLQRLPEVDLYLHGLIQTRKLAISTFPYDIRLPLEYKSTPQDEIRLDETKRRFRRAKMDELISTIMDGILYGLSAAQLVWSNTQFGTMVTDKFIYDLTDIDFSETTNGLVEYTGFGIEKEELDPDVHILTRYNPLTNRKDYVGSLMRSAMLLSFLKYHTRWDWRDLNKRHGVPATYATYPEHMDYSDPEDKKKIDDLAAMVGKLKNDSYAVFPDYVKILYDEALKNDSKESFNQFIATANLELAILLHGQNLTTEVKSGSLAAAKVQDKVDDLIIEADLRVVSNIFSEQYLIKDFQLNYGEPINDYFEFYFIHEVQTDYESNSRIITNLFADPVVKAKIPLKEDEVYKKLGFTKPAPNDIVI